MPAVGIYMNGGRRDVGLHPRGPFLTEYLNTYFRNNSIIKKVSSGEAIMKVSNTFQVCLCRTNFQTILPAV